MARWNSSGGDGGGDPDPDEGPQGVSEEEALERNPFQRLRDHWRDARMTPPVEVPRLSDREGITRDILLATDGIMSENSQAKLAPQGRKKVSQET